MARINALIGLFMLASPALGQTPQPIDLNPHATAQDGLDGLVFAEPIADAPGGEFFFVGHDPVHKTEIWRSDGTQAGTVRVSDLGPGGVFTELEINIAHQGRVYFTASWVGEGREPFVTDGTGPGTQRLADIQAGVGHSSPRDYLGVGGQVFFSALNSGLGRELWFTDGTPAGTQLFADLEPGSGGSDPQALTAVPGTGRFVFRAEVGGQTGLWASDGTLAGTGILIDLTPWPLKPSTMTPLVTLGSHVLFWRYSASTGQTLWKTDGTLAGTVMVADLDPASGTDELSLGETGVLGGELYFTARTPAAGLRVWRTDGVNVAWASPVLTTMQSTPIRAFCAASGRVFYVVNEASGPKLHATTGSPATAGFLHALPFDDSGPLGVFPKRFTALGNDLVFSGGTTTTGHEVWFTDGTPGGLTMLPELSGGGSDGVRSDFIDDGSGSLSFAGRTAATGQEWFRTDGATITLVAEIDPLVLTADSQPGSGVAFGGRWVDVSAKTQAQQGREPVRVLADGTVIELGDLNAGTGNSSPNGFTTTQVGGTLLTFFSAYTSSSSARSVCVTDGTPGGTYVHANGTLNSPFGFTFRPVAGGMLIAAGINSYEQELWFSNGTTLSALGVMARFEEEPEGFLVDLGDRYYFSGHNGDGDWELWSTDGTVAGTARVADIKTDGPSGPLDLRRVGDRIAFFAATTGKTALSLHASDGTAAGTTFVSNINLSTAPYSVAVMDATLFFLARNGFVGEELWRSDLTTAGTFRVTDLEPGAGSPEFNRFVVAGDRLFFDADVPSLGVGQELFVSDGTTAGTQLVADLMPGPESAFISGLFAVGERVFFSARQDVSVASELFVADAASIQLVADIDSIPGSSSDPLGFVLVGGELWFSATESFGVGRELFRLDLDTAFAFDLGLGHGPALLEATAPILGQTVTTRLRHGAPGWSHFVVGSFPVANPIETPFTAFGHPLWLNPVQYFQIGTSVQPSADHSFAIPANPALNGLPFNLQVLSLDPLSVGAPTTSNGVRAVLGS